MQNNPFQSIFFQRLALWVTFSADDILNYHKYRLKNANKWDIEENI